MSKLKIASILDREDVYQLVKALIEEGYQGQFGFSETRLRDTVDSWLQAPHNEKICVLAYNDAGEAVGVLAAYAGFPFFSDESIAQHIAWYTKPSARKTSVSLKLMRAFEAWASKIGAQWNIAGFKTTYTSDLHGFFRKKGYTNTEMLFVKRND